MKKLQTKVFFCKYWILCFLTLLIIFSMRFCCRITDSDALTWILAPTTRWASFLGNIPFEYLPHQGYVNHFYRFLIAPSCSGIRFMTTTFLMLVFSFLYQIPSVKAGYLWFAFSIAFSYCTTILVNGIRIVVSIYLPIPLEQAGILNGWLNPDRLHTLIGTVVYFSSLCAIYPVASFICQRVFIRSTKETIKAAPDNLRHGFKLLIPSFWYLSAVLVLPFLRRILQNDWNDFGSYAVLIIGVCVLISVPIALINKLD